MGKIFLADVSCDTVCPNNFKSSLNLGENLHFGEAAVQGIGASVQGKFIS